METGSAGWEPHVGRQSVSTGGRHLGGTGWGRPGTGGTALRLRAWLCSQIPGDKDWLTRPGTLGT